MQYKPETEKVAMMDTAYIPVPTPLSLAEDHQVQRTRKVFLIILGVCLGFTVCSFVGAIFGSGIEHSRLDGHRTSLIGQAIIGIVSYGFGILVAYKYSSIGLRIFAWFCIIELVFVGIAVVLLLFVIIIGVAALGAHADKHSPGAGAGILVGASVSGFILLVVLVAAVVLSVIIIKLAFKLARLIDANKRVVIPQI